MLQRSVTISVSMRSRSRAHTFWYVAMVVTIETTTPKRRARKTSFWSTLDTPIFLIFSNPCCLGSCAAVATLKQMLANNCYETHERSAFFDLGPRTSCGCGRRPHSSPKGELPRGSGGMLESSPGKFWTFHCLKWQIWPLLQKKPLQERKFWQTLLNGIF